MHQTTIRFGDDLWAALEVAAEQLEISAAQFVRDAALARLAYDAGRRDGETFPKVFSTSEAKQR